MKTIISCAVGTLMGFFSTAWFTHIALAQASDKEMDLLRNYQTRCELSGGFVIEHMNSIICARGSMRTGPKVGLVKPIE